MKKEFKKRILSSIVLLPLSLFFIIKGSYFFNFFLLICFFVTTYEWFMMSKNKEYHFLGYFFLIFSFYTTFALRNDIDEKSYVFFIIVLTICISTDIGGYFFGKLFKGPKLTKISPKKTYSGMIGGYFLSIISVYILLVFLNNEAKNLITFNFNLEIFILVLILSTISQMGDITISLFKRFSKIKDTGNIIPGHGGLLDRVDGMLFAFPASFIIFNLIY